MALITCPACKKKISEDAISCPHCGDPTATRRQATAGNKAQAVVAKKDQKKRDGLGCAILIAIPVSIWIIASITKSPPTPEQQAQEQAAKQAEEARQKEADASKAESAAACRQDLHCYIQDKFVGAGIWCADPIKKLAKYDMKWTDAWYEPKFDKASWLSKAKGTLTFYGDKAQFQNGFGAYVNITYECDYDPSQKDDAKVLDVRIHQPD